IDVGSLRDVDEFQQQADEFLEYVKATPLAAGASEIRVPGEQSEKARQHGLKHGLDLAAHVAEDFRQVAKSLNMNVPWFIQANECPSRSNPNGCPDGPYIMTSFGMLVWGGAPV